MLFTILVLSLRRLGGGDATTALPSSRFELGWPRGVQEEEPVHFRTELLAPRRPSHDPLTEARERQPAERMVAPAR